MLKAGLGAGAGVALLTQGVQYALALLLPEMLNPATPLGSDYTVFRSVNKLTAHPHNYQVYEVPNCVVVDPFAFSKKGFACAVHGFSVHRDGVMASDQLGVTPGTGTRPLLGRAHYVVIEVPNPAWKSTTNPINGRWLHWEGLVDLTEVALSPIQRSEVWYFTLRRGQHEIGANIKLGFVRDGNQVRLATNGNWKWRSRYGYGLGNTPFRPGDETVPAIALSPTVPTTSVLQAPVPSGMSFKVDNALYFQDIPRDAGGRTQGLQTTAWLRHDNSAYPASLPALLAAMAMWWCGPQAFSATDDTPIPTPEPPTLTPEPPSPTATATPTDTPTPMPTNTPAPPTPTSTPAPPTPTPTPVANMTPIFPRMPAGADFDPDPAVLAQLSASARTAYLALNA
jgi:hypothetical protein